LFAIFFILGNDPKRGYSFDMNFDSRDPKKMLKLEHACVEGLPCTPPAAELYILSSQGSSIDVKPVPDSAAVVDVSPFIYISLVLCFLGGAIVYLLMLNQKLRSHLEQRSGGDFANEGNGGRDNVVEDEDASPLEAMGSSTPYHAMDEDQLVNSQENGCCLRDDDDGSVEIQTEMQSLLDSTEE
jgi:hypothetical protein